MTVVAANSNALLWITSTRFWTNRGRRALQAPSILNPEVTWFLTYFNRFLIGGYLNSKSQRWSAENCKIVLHCEHSKFCRKPTVTNWEQREVKPAGAWTRLQRSESVVVYIMQGSLINACLKSTSWWRVKISELHWLGLIWTAGIFESVVVYNCR